MGLLVAGVLLLALICQSHSHGVRSPLSRFKRYQETAWSDPNDCSRQRQPVIQTSSHNLSLDIRMPGVIPAASDSYLCVAVPMPVQREAYIVDFVPHASMDTAHHMLLYGCRTPVSTKGYWDCGGEQGTCADEAKIMYAWARNAPPTKLPRDVGFKVGGDTGITHFVLQIHYGDVHAFRDHHRDCSGLTLRMTSIPQPFIAGMYLMMSVDTVIPPGKRVTNADIACSYSSYPMHPFAFRTHTHRLGQVVSGYRVRNGKWTLIGRQSPQLPQAFYTASNFVTVENGDMLAARCVFTGEGRTTKTRIGGTSQDEMCNFYIMYYMDSKHAVPYMDCMEHGSSRLFKDMPEEANVPVPVPPEFTMTGMRHGAGATDHQDDSALLEPKREEEQLLDQGDFYSLLSKLLGEREDVVHVHKYNPAEAERAKVDLVAEIDSIMQKKDSAWPSPRLAYNVRDKAILVRDRVHKFHQLESTVRPTGTKIMAAKWPDAVVAKAEKPGVHLGEVADWPEVPLQLGQVSGLALDSDGNLIIFHRGDHRWGLNSFDIQGRYQQRSFGPIQQSTILVVDPNKGSVLKASGRNMFYLPHGISTDKDDNYWVTDVALHQVFKLGNKDRPVVVLGEAFEPGNDRNHFCKPTDVAVDPVTGNVFVSDGYCNSRIIVFSPEGKFITEWGAGGSDRRKRIPFSVPHSLVFLPDKRELCVADRENGRIQCFLAESGDFTKEIKKDEFGGKVFAVSYAPVHGGLMYAVNGRSGLSVPLQGFVVNYSTKEILDTFSPESQEFRMPHDIVVSRDGTVFVGDADTNSVIKFVPSGKAEHRSVKKGGIEVQEIQETETFVQAHLKPLIKFPAQGAVATAQKTPGPAQKSPDHHEQQQVQTGEKPKEKSVVRQTGQGVSPAIITTLLLIPLVVVLVVGVFIRWRKSRMYGDGCEVKLEPNSSGGILGKLRGKAAGSLNLGNFFATHKGYTRQGFDRLSTEGSDQEKDDEDATDSENEEYSAPPPPVSSTS
ncbi:peptidyl-glycine alpha-amidating monooxygenase B isoform X1 [Denticeps clupeoides]|uniref:Peptidyl-glycine alpha-amidating monooxygenase n=1 Tax=Denticeps clupeoides TaxID=299321 RepID=A0AAY4BW84_9TELE|nr:peptidyl-glycine alpha-amidating monooxygenase isoform X1 [Denticeps clupeoides]